MTATRIDPKIQTPEAVTGHALLYPGVLDALIEAVNDHADNIDDLEFGSSPFPPAPVEIVLYARTNGDDTTGDGSLATPFRTTPRALERAAQLSPIAPGYTLNVDITGIGEDLLPLNYEFPTIVAPNATFLPVDFGGPVPAPFDHGASFNIRAFPQPASNIPLADTSVLAAEIISVTSDLFSQQVTIEVQRGGGPIDSWATDALEGKFLTVEGSGILSAAIHGSSVNGVGPGFSSFIEVAQDFDAYTGSNLSIVEPSATLKGQTDFTTLAAINVYNCPQIAFQGIKFTSDDTNQPLAVFGGTIQNFVLCDIHGLLSDGASLFSHFGACVIRNGLGNAGGGNDIFNTVFLDAFLGAFFGGHGVGFVANAVKRCGFLGTTPVFTGNSPSYPSPGYEIVDCLFKDGTSRRGSVWGNGGSSFALRNVRIDGNVGPGVRMDGCGTFATMENVGGTGNGIGSTGGSPAASFTLAGVVVTLVDPANRFRSTMVGLTVDVVLATTPGNNGPFVITGYIDPTTITYTNAGGATEPFAAATTWTIREVGVHAHDDAVIRVLDDATNVTGLGGHMKTGTVIRAWGTAPATPPGNFRFDAPIKNQHDFAFPIVGDEVTGAGTGGPSGARIFQRPA